MTIKNAEKDWDVAAHTPNPQNVYVTIYDTDHEVPDDQDVGVIELQGAGDPLHILTIDNAEDKFTPIKGKQAVIKFLSSSIDMTTFSSGEDNRWYVTVTVGEVDNKFVFKGFLVMDDFSEAFMPVPNEVTLVATDNLGLLKDIPLTDFEDENPQGKHRIIDFVAWCLGKTSLELDIFVVSNEREETHSLFHFWDAIYLDSKTFEEEIGLSEDCYTVLEKILGENCFLTQWKGNWWVMRIDEFDLHSIFRSRFTSDGTFVNHLSETTYPKIIKKDGAKIFFSEEATMVRPYRQSSFIKETYKYVTPLEAICNIDFSRGEFVENLDDEVIESKTNQVEKHTIECWTYYKGVPNVAQDSEAYVKKYFYNGYEKDHFVFMPATADADLYYLGSDERFPITIGDKFEIGVDFKFSSDLGGGSGHFIQQTIWVRLYGEDGTFWNLYAPSGSGTADPSIKWVQSNSSWTTNTRFVQYEGEANQVDFREWQNVQVEAAPVPVSGNIEILLLNNSDPDDQDKSFTNLSFTYLPLINGSYRKFSGQYHQITQAGDYKAKRDEEVFISDSPRRLFKGAMFIENSGEYLLAGRFYNHAVFSTGVPADEFLHPFGEIQAFSVWNQFRKEGRIFEFTCQGLDSGSLDADGWVDTPDLLHKFILQDPTQNTNNRYFMLLHYDMDFYKCEWKGVFIEVYNTIYGKDYASPHVFKYIS